MMPGNMMPSNLLGALSTASSAKSGRLKVDVGGLKAKKKKLLKKKLVKAKEVKIKKG